MSDLQQLEEKMDRLTVLVECLLRAFGETSTRAGETLQEVAGCAYGRTAQGQAFILLYPAAGQKQEAVCRAFGERFD